MSWLGAISQQAITCANTDPDRYHHIASLGHDELIIDCCYIISLIIISLIVLGQPYWSVSAINQVVYSSKLPKYHALRWCGHWRHLIVRRPSWWRHMSVKFPQFAGHTTVSSKSLSRLTTKKSFNLCITGPVCWESTGTLCWEFLWWRHYALYRLCIIVYVQLRLRCWFNVKMPSYSLKIPILEVSYDCFISTMGFPIQARSQFILNRGVPVLKLRYDTKFSNIQHWFS